MQEISFSIPVSGTIRIGDNTITITVNRAETIINFEKPEEKEEHLVLAKGRTIFDVVLEAAQSFIKSNGENRFTAASLYREVIGKYPGLKRNSWTAHMIASAPNHPSYRHYGSRRDYFEYLGNGTYNLVPKYLTANDNVIEEK